MDSKFQSELHVLDTDDVKQRTSLFSVLGKSAFIGPVLKNNPQTPITAILSTYLLHEFIMNVN